MTRVYHYPNCSTCKKALRWLDEREIPHKRVHIVDAPPSGATIKRLWKRSGLPIKRFFNTSGKSYREGKFGEKLKTMSEQEAIDALAADGKLIKRPLVDGKGDDGTFTLVGFKEAEWQDVFEG